MAKRYGKLDIEFTKSPKRARLDESPQASGSRIVLSVKVSNSREKNR